MKKIMFKAVLAVLSIMGVAYANTATFSTGASCTYTEVKIGQQGNMIIQCAGDIPPPVGPPTLPPVTPPAPPTAGCPANAGTPVAFGKAGDKLDLTGRSGQIFYMALPKIPSDGKNSGYLNILDSPGLASPPGNTVEISISKCPGVIDTNTANSCNKRFNEVGYVSYYWFARTTPRFPTPQAINAAGACYAPESEGQWYFNTRWTFQQCAFGYTVCGFKFYWTPGSF